MTEIDEETLVDALDRLHGKNRWRVPHRTKHGEGMLRNDMRLLLEAAAVAQSRRRNSAPSKAS